MAPTKSTKFQLECLENPKYSEWIKFKSNNEMADCKICLCAIDLSNMGKRALDSHTKSKKHTSKTNTKSSLIKKMFFYYLF